MSNFTPHLSNIFFKFSNYLNSNFIFGYALFPSLVAVILYKIFYKLLGLRLWSLSITMLAMTATENFPFIGFLKNIINSDMIFNSVNKYENFEIFQPGVSSSLNALGLFFRIVGFPSSLNNGYVIL